MVLHSLCKQRHTYRWCSTVKGKQCISYKRRSSTPDWSRTADRRIKSVKHTDDGGAGQLAANSQTLRDGAATLKGGIDSAKSGIDTLKSGTDTLKGGTDTLKTGADTLKSGAGTLQSGINTLKSGTSALSSGADT